MNYIPVYVINLKKDKDRLNHMSTRLLELNIKFSIIDAVLGSKLNEVDKSKFKFLRPRREGKTWSDGQIGCFLSHYQTWCEIARSSEKYAVVLEDDLFIADDFKEVVTNSFDFDFDILRLEISPNLMKLSRNFKRATNKRIIREVFSDSWCTGAYMISQKAAKILIDSDPILHSTADEFLFSKSTSIISKKLNIYQCCPAICIQDKFTIEGSLFVSNIESQSVPIKHMKKNYFLEFLRCVKCFFGYKSIKFIN